MRTTGVLQISECKRYRKNRWSSGRNLFSKPSVPVLFNEAGIKGENKDKWVKIKWQNSFETDSRFIYYGKGTRNEYRITNFGRNFPFLNSEYTGALFVLVKQDENEYTAFILNTDADIEEFMDALGISPADTNNLIKKRTGTSVYFRIN